METNKFDKDIKKKFENRTFKPSASAWERLSVQLDEQPKEKKKGWFFYIGAAASILLLVSLGIQLVSNDSQEIIPQDEIVIKPIDKQLIDKKIEQLINEIPLEEAIVKKVISIEKGAPLKNTSIKKESKVKTNNLNIVIKKQENIRIAQVEKKRETIIEKEHKTPSTNIKQVIEDNVNSTIKINPDDLLYAVTHSPKEVKEYYAKYNVSRDDVLKTIKNELKKSNIKMNPETMLAEVELNISDDDFQNNFLKSVKRRVSDLASAIASRNN